MHRRKLPIGIQTFAKIREDDYYYVDKTGFIRQLIAEGGQYFPTPSGPMAKIADNVYYVKSCGPH